MPRLEAILCPVDYSENSRRTLRYAAAFAARTRAHLTILHVTETLLASAAAACGLNPLDAKARAELSSFVCDALPGSDSWLAPPTLDLRVGEPHEQILATAHQRDADLIIMGTHGQSGYEKLLFGSTTERVVRQARVPVLAVPLAPVDPTTLTSTGARLNVGPIVAAIDFADGSVELTRFAADVAEMFGSPLVLLHVVPHVHAPASLESALEAEESLRHDRAHRRLDELAADAMAGGQAETIVACGRPAEEIAGHAVRLEARIIVLGLQSGGLFGTRPGAVAYRVLCLTQTPVLVVPPPTTPRTRPDRRQSE